MCRSLAGRSPLIPGKISPDQVKNGIALVSGPVILPFYSSLFLSLFLLDELCVGLLKVKALITCLIANLFNELLLIE
jgi:hypothetical protein